MSNFFRRTNNRKLWFADFDGVDTTVKDRDSVLSYTFDLSQDEKILSDGLSISTVIWTASGVVLTNRAVASPQFSVTVAELGEAEALVTYSDGQVENMLFRWRDASATARGGNDYGNR